MAIGKKAFTAYCDWIETFESLPDDKAGQLIKHLFRYVNDLNPVTDDILINAVFANIKQTLKRDLKKYEIICKRNKENGLKGGRPEKPKKPSGLFGNPEKPKKPDRDIDTDKDINNPLNPPIGENGLTIGIDGKKYDLGIINTKLTALNFIDNITTLKKDEKAKIKEKINLLNHKDFSSNKLAGIMQVRSIIVEVVEND